MSASSEPASSDALADQEIQQLLRGFVRRRVPEHEVDDVVQTVLCDALDAARRPAGGADLRRWLIGIARHKVADYHRASRRRAAGEAPEVAVEPAPHEARALARWAVQASRSEYRSEQTLGWMARESEGEPLAAIAASEQLPAPRIRQRISRLRRTLRRRWIEELALVAGAGLVALLVWHLATEPSAPRTHYEPSWLTPEPAVQRGRRIRGEALRYCDQERWRTCLQGLDQAKRLDPAGDLAPPALNARARAEEALAPPPPTDGKLEGPAPPPPPKKAPAPKPTSESSPTAPMAPTGVKPRGMKRK